MTTLEEDYEALLKRAHDEKVTLTTLFYEGLHPVQVFYHEGKVWIYSEGTKDDRPVMAATFDPKLMLDLLPYLMLAANTGLKEEIKKLTDDVKVLLGGRLPACPKCGAVDFDGTCEHGLTPDEEFAKKAP